MLRKGRECAGAGSARPSLASWDSLENQPQSPVSERVEGGPVKDLHPEAENTVSPWDSPGSSILGWGCLSYRLRSLCHLASGEVRPSSDANCSVSQSCHRLTPLPPSLGPWGSCGQPWGLVMPPSLALSAWFIAHRPGACSESTPGRVPKPCPRLGEESQH